MRGVWLTGWLLTRIVFVVLWRIAEPVGEANVWLKQKWLESA